jgi:methylase of polypeptide subunit release factors
MLGASARVVSLERFMSIAAVAEAKDREIVLGDAPLALDIDPVPVRELLRNAGYTAEGLDKALGANNAAAITPLEIPLYLRKLNASPRLATLARLFLLRSSAGRAEAVEAVRPLTLDYLQALGLVEINGDRVDAPVSITTFDDLHFVCDRYRESLGEIAVNHVTGVNPTSIVLASITIRRPIDSALDLGTGCGVQALLAARHARRVVATDMNRRALNMAAFNARLNGFTNVECRYGSFFEPVAGEKFDLIATNPPYVISPESRFLFRDAGQRGDGVSRMVAEQLPKHLNEGGTGHQLCNWICELQKDWAEPVRRWVAEAGVDTLALGYLVEDPLSYASKWLKPEFFDNPSGFGPALDRWVDYFKTENIRALVTGSLTYRRRTAKNWFQGYMTPGQSLAPCGHQLLRIFQIQDFLNELPRPEALLDCKLRLGRDHWLEQTWEYKHGRYDLAQSHLRLNQTIGFSGTIDEYGTDLVAGCNGDNRLGDLVRNLAERLGKPVEELAATILGLVRDLMLMGFLTPAELE